MNYVNSEKQKRREINIADTAASFQQAVLDVIVTKAVDAALNMNESRLVLAGGVAANSRLREMLNEACRTADIALYCPSPILCTDNAAMMGCAAYYRAQKGYFDGLDMDAYAQLDIESA